MDDLSGDVQSDLIDLTEISMDDLRQCDPRIFAESLDRILQQIEKPRFNLGTGPPGQRID
ncbi:hypothetical protein [Catenuloplanes japonicus]|uniref:hypothetical protein n=1 Tax=Catenuloplanes japonicus TaxID=33876 RepID=UPI000ACBAA18|nr:hypothetical protein [Catenuloplanes japonicus]